MMKKYKLSVVIIILAFTVGCSSDKENKDSKVNTTSSETYTESDSTEFREETTIDQSKLYPDEVTMASDIDKLQKNEIAISDSVYILETKSVEIEKASKNDKNFNVYCYAIQENEEFTAKNYYNLVYNYYEIGGWKLDECILEEIDMKPQKICSQELASVAINNKYFLTRCEYVSSEKVNDYEYIYHFKGITEYNYMDQLYDLVVYCNFSNDYGWSCYADYTNIHSDWSKIYGTWYGENGEYICKVDIKEIDYNNFLITYNIEISNWRGFITSSEMTTSFGYTTDYGMDEYNAKYCVETELQREGENYTTNSDLYFDENYGLKRATYSVSRINMNKVQ